MVRTATVQEIEEHLKRLGAGNHIDNMNQVRRFSHHYSLTLNADDFFSLVFCEIPEVSRIVPSQSDRRLRAVAERAIKLSESDTYLGSNWDIAEIKSRSLTASVNVPGYQIPALLLRDVGRSEAKWSPNGWYLQDGAHRALGYAMMVLEGRISYRSQSAYCATNRIIAVAP